MVNMILFVMHACREDLILILFYLMSFLRLWGNLLYLAFTYAISTVASPLGLQAVCLSHLPLPHEIVLTLDIYVNLFYLLHAGFRLSTLFLTTMLIFGLVGWRLRRETKCVQYRATELIFMILCSVFHIYLQTFEFMLH